MSGEVRAYTPKERKAELQKQFFEKFGRIPMPMCFKCRKKVAHMGVDVDLDRGEIVTWVKCHKDREECREKIEKVLDPRTKINWGGVAFVPKFGTREGGVILQPMNV